MRQITDENGAIYVSKEDMESAIKDRISKVTQRARDYEEQLQAANEKIATMTKEYENVDILTAKIRDLETNLSKSQNQFTRYKAISQHGLVDDEIIEAIEWAYERTMSKVSEKDKTDLSTWIQGQIDNIESAHPLLKPHLQNQNKAPSHQNDETPQGDPVSVPSNNNTPPLNGEFPRVNKGAKKPPETRNIIDQGLADPEFYEANRDAILKAYKNLTGGSRHGG